MSDARQYVWNVLSQELLGKPVVDSGKVVGTSGEVALPDFINSGLVDYFATGDRVRLNEVAIATADTFYLVPDLIWGHLVLIAFLLRNHLISAQAASRYVQVDAANFPAMDAMAVDLVDLAATVAEEDALGLCGAGDDDFLRAHLDAYAKMRGFHF